MIIYNDTIMKGQISLLALLLIIFLLFMIVSSIYSKQHSYATITIEEIVWINSDGIKINTARSNQLVQVKITISSLSKYDGYISFKVRKDTRFLPDKNIAYLKQFYSLEKGQKISITLSFVAEKGFLTRGYFVEIDWRNGKYVMENSYPPRLRVIP